MTTRTVFQEQIGGCTYKLAVIVTACRGPGQTPARQKSQHERRRWAQSLPLAEEQLALDSCRDRESQFIL